MHMKLLPKTPLTRCYLVTAGILSVGFGTAVTIYLTADEIHDNPFAEFEQSKRFAYEVQRMGGKMALVANDASIWFTELWQGRQLAYTVACITMVIALGYYIVASGAKPGDCAALPRDDNGGF
jgi:UDP-N-acetylmuramyl pentapeptide phosphotransferase/UDP-N-acetylglucosamine-1-phosphate transferase